MLKHFTDRSVVVKKISIVTCCDSLNELLLHLLPQWKFEIHEPTSSDVLLLAEEECAEPVEGQKVIWLTRSQYHGRERLSLPVTIEDLWQTLELRFHQPPRKHIRMGVEMNASVSLNGETVTVRLSSLSDMGARFIFHRELVRDQQVFVTLTVGSETLRIDSRIIYAIPRSVNSEGEVKVGVLFRGIEKDQRDELRSFLILRYLREVQDRMSGPRFAEALEFLALSEKVKDNLLG